MSNETNFDSMVEKSYRIDERLDTVPLHVTHRGVQAITVGSPWQHFSVSMRSFDSFVEFCQRQIGGMSVGEEAIVDVDKDEARATFRWPHFADQKATLMRCLTEEATAWLHKIESINHPKAMAEFLEDYGEWLAEKDPQGNPQGRRLDLVESLKNLRITNRTDGSIEYRPHGDRAEFSVSRDAKSSTSIELPILLYATPQLHVGDDRAYLIKVRINYSVDEDSKVTVRCRVANRDSLFMRATEDLTERLKDELAAHNVQVFL